MSTTPPQEDAPTRDLDSSEKATSGTQFSFERARSCFTEHINTLVPKMKNDQPETRRLFQFKKTLRHVI